MKTKRKRIFTYVIAFTLISGTIVGMNFSKTALAVTGSDTSHAEYGEQLKDQTPASLGDASWSWYTGDKSEWVWVDDENSYFGDAGQQTLVARNATATAFDAVTFNVNKRGITPVVKVNGIGSQADFVTTPLANIMDSAYSKTITVTAGTGGTVAGGGTYPIGKTVNITATPSSGYKFSQWNDGITTASRNIIVNGDKIYTAGFSKIQYTITVQSNNTSYGTVSGGGTYDVGSSVIITAAPKPGYEFVKWNDGNTNASRSVTVSSNKTYTATFEEEDIALPTKAGDALIMTIRQAWKALGGSTSSVEITWDPSEGYNTSTYYVYSITGSNGVNSTSTDLKAVGISWFQQLNKPTTDGTYWRVGGYKVFGGPLYCISYNSNSDIYNLCWEYSKDAIDGSDRTEYWHSGAPGSVYVAIVRAHE